LERLECSLCKVCIEACEPGAISVAPILDSFVVSIESCGSIRAKGLVAMASEEVRKRAEDLDAKLAELA